MPKAARAGTIDAALHRTMTRENFLAWAEGQDGRYEFDGLQPVALAGGTNDHGTIAGNLNGQLYLRLRGRPCQSMPPRVGGVATIGSRVRFPDATVTCSPVVGIERLVPDPVVVFEVLDPSPARDDEAVRTREYQAVPTIRRCVLIDQAKVAVTVRSRSGEVRWEAAPPLGAGAVLELPEIGISIPVDDLYERVAFSR